MAWILAKATVLARGGDADAAAKLLWKAIGESSDPGNKSDEAKEKDTVSIQDATQQKQIPPLARNALIGRPPAVLHRISDKCLDVALSASDPRLAARAFQLCPSSYRSWFLGLKMLRCLAEGGAHPGVLLRLAEQLAVEDRERNTDRTSRDRTSRRAASVAREGNNHEDQHQDQARSGYEANKTRGEEDASEDAGTPPESKAKIAGRRPRSAAKSRTTPPPHPFETALQFDDFRRIPQAVLSVIDLACTEHGEAPEVRKRLRVMMRAAGVGFGPDHAVRVRQRV